jgi:hypothetical protein
LQLYVFGDPSLTLRDDTKVLWYGGEKSGDSQITFDIHYFLLIATFFPLYDPEKSCHPEA